MKILCEERKVANDMPENEGAIREAARLLLEKVAEHLAGVPAAELTPQAAKQTSSALKDIRDLLDEGKSDDSCIRVALADELSELAE